MTENFNLLNEKVEKGWNALKQEIQEHPKTAYAVVVGVLVAAVVFDKKIAPLFPSGEKLLGELKLGSAARDLFDRSIPIGSVDRAAVLRGLERSTTPQGLEGGARVLSITAGQRVRTARTIADHIKSGDLVGVAAPAQEAGQAFYGKLAPKVTSAEVTAAGEEFLGRRILPWSTNHAATPLTGIGEELFAKLAPPLNSAEVNAAGESITSGRVVPSYHTSEALASDLRPTTTARPQNLIVINSLAKTAEW